MGNECHYDEIHDGAGAKRLSVATISKSKAEYHLRTRSLDRPLDSIKRPWKSKCRGERELPSSWSKGERI